MLIFLRILAALFAIAPISVVAQEAPKENIWLASKRARADVDAMISPNLAITIPVRELTEFLDRSLRTIESRDVGLQFAKDGLSIGHQNLLLRSSYYIRLPPEAGPIAGQFLRGEVTLAFGVTFSGTAFHLLPWVVELSIKEPEGFAVDSIKIPDWLQRALLVELQKRDLLQLPVSLATQYSISTDHGDPAVTFSKSVATMDLWVNSTAVLLDRSGLAGLAQVNFDLTVPKCHNAGEMIFGLTEDAFTRYGDTTRIPQIGSDTPAIGFRGKLANHTFAYELVWRLNGVGYVTLQLPIEQSGPRRGSFEATLPVLPHSNGLYSAVILAKYKIGGLDKTCLVATRNIVRAQKLDLDVPPDLTREQAIREFENYLDAFVAKMGVGKLPPRLGSLSLSITKATLSEAIEKSTNGIAINGIVDTSKLPPLGKAVGKIKIPDGTDISCTPSECWSKRSCSRGGRCPIESDNRDCMRSVFGVRVSDPICETGRTLENARLAAENLACNFREEAAVADCERLRQFENGACITQRGIQQSACFAHKATVDLMRLANAGADFAGVDADFKISGPASFSVANLTLDRALRSFVLQMLYGADLAVDATVSFTAYNVGGHSLGCLIDWRAPVALRVFAAPSRRSISGNLRFDKQKLIVDVGLPKTDVNVSPPPLVALFAQNPHLIVNCPLLFRIGAGASLLALLDRGEGSKALRGEFTLPEYRFNYEIDLPRLDVSSTFGSSTSPPPKLNLYDEGEAITWR